MKLSTIEQWLAWITTVHASDIELGLDRVRQVAEALGVLTPSCPTIVVAGTNGKGTTVATLEAIYQAAHYQVGSFTSPYLFRFNEEVKINGIAVSDEELCRAFAAVDAARGEITLTPFEFQTLAALIVLQSYPLDLMILEIGLGGRLDAVNIIDGAVAIVTTIALDHMDYLGTTRESIATEKAGIFRSNAPAICGDEQPPASLIAAAKAQGTVLYRQGQDFNYQLAKTEWTWQCPQLSLTLPLSGFAYQNISSALMAVTLLQTLLPVTAAEIVAGIKNIKLQGRIEVFADKPMRIFDVAHNPHAVMHLANYLSAEKIPGKTLAVFSMLADKDIVACLQGIKEQIDAWFVAPLLVKRGASGEELKQAFLSAGVGDNFVEYFDTIEIAYAKALLQAKENDRVVIFGSFYTVARTRSVRD